jgi:hypothetical protein
MAAVLKAQFFGLHAHLTSLRSIFLLSPLGMFEEAIDCASTVDAGEEMWRRIQQFASKIKRA